MTVATSSIPAALTALVTAATAAFPTALVFDGPMLVVDEEAWPDRVTIGWDGDTEANTTAVEGDQDFNALNRGVTRDENYKIVCSVTHIDGNNDTTEARNAAFALLASFEKLLRGVPPNGSGDVTLGGAVLWAHVAGGIAVDYVATENGTACHITFHVTCRARLTGS